MLFISNDTISTIEQFADGKARLTYYKNGIPVFVKVYRSFRSARIAEGKLMKKYLNGGFEK